MIQESQPSWENSTESEDMEQPRQGNITFSQRGSKDYTTNTDTKL